MWLVGLGFSESQKMVLVNSDQYLESYLWSILYWNLKKVIYPNDDNDSSAALHLIDIIF